MFGDRYIAQHIQQSYLQRADRFAYRCYVTDMLRAIAMSGMVGARVETRYADMIQRDSKPQKTAKQVIRSMRAEFEKLGWRRAETS